MSGFLDDREHAAENLFVHNEELLFLAHRAGVRDLAMWAAEEIGLEPEAREPYVAKFLDAFVAGVTEVAIVKNVQQDLAGAGKSESAPKASQVFAQAVALASGELSGRVPPKPMGRPAAEMHRTHPIGASLSWRD